MTSIIEYWREISITVGGIVMFITGRKSTKLIEKKQHTDAISSMQQTYDLFLIHYEKQYQLMQKQYEGVLTSNLKITEDLDKIRKQFISLQLAYAKEVEMSANWQKLHSELEKQHQALNKKYDILLKQYEDSDRKHEELMKLYEKLKADFEKHKKIK